MIGYDNVTILPVELRWIQMAELSQRFYGLIVRIDPS